jgi:monothiol glutaredoxin
MDVMDRIRQQIESSSIVLYMKGTPERPMCGFSNYAARALQACNAQFTAIDVLADPEIRANLPRYANWPTFPQLYIKGELIGGADIMRELYEAGELQKMVDAAR